MSSLKYLIVGLVFVLMSTGAYATIKPKEDSLRTAARVMEVKYDLPAGLLEAVCEQESNYRNVAGRHGEIGVCQIKPSTVDMIAPGYYKTLTNRVFTFKSTGDEVATIQAALARSGFYTLTIHGIYDTGTYKAVLAYQAANSLKADGIVGPRTWAKLLDGEPYPGMTITTALWDPAVNIEWAARYLVWLRDNVSDDAAIMLASYNGGPGNPIVRYMLSVKRLWGRNRS